MIDYRLVHIKFVPNPISMKYIISSERIKLMLSLNLANVTLQAYTNFSYFIVRRSLRFYTSGAENSALVLN